MKKCKSGRIIEKNRKGKIIYVLRLNLVEDDFKKGKKYTTKDIHTDLSVGKRNYQKAAVLLEEAMDSYKDDGHLYTPDYFSKSFKKVVRRNPNLDDSLTLHSLRASCVSILVHNGMDIKDIQEWVGHKDIQTTLNLYARTNEKRKTKVDKKMSEIVFKDA